MIARGGTPTRMDKKSRCPEPGAAERNDAGNNQQLQEPPQELLGCMPVRMNP